MPTKTVQDTRARRGQTGGGSQRRGNHVKSEVSNRAPLNSTFREGSRGKTTPSTHAVTVTTQEALDGYREKAMRIASDFSVGSARDVMRHVIESSAPDVIVGSVVFSRTKFEGKDKETEERALQTKKGRIPCRYRNSYNSSCYVLLSC